MYLVKGWGGDIMRLRQNFLLIKWCQDLFQFNYDQSEAMDIIDLMTHLNSWPCALGNSIFQATTLLILFRIQRVYFCWLQKPVWNQNFYISKYFGLWNIDKQRNRVHIKQFRRSLLKFTLMLSSKFFWWWIRFLFFKTCR